MVIKEDKLNTSAYTDTPMSSSFIINTLLFGLLPLFSLAFDSESKSNVAVYWGQNSAGSQKSLAYYCQNSDADIFLLSFLYEFPTLGLNFANACSDTFSDGLLHCSQIGADIQTCQDLGKKVLLSLGGASGAYGFSDNTAAETFAETLWDTFGEGSGSERPFDSAVVDGFDFDIENKNSVGYAALAKKLRTLFKEGSKQYYLSAAPQCPFPDASVGNLLENADIDFAFIQFYNNYCNVEGTSFNWDTWVTYANSISPNSDIKLYLGLPGASGAAGSGYISDMNSLVSVIQSISTGKNFGGISLWDASQGFANIIDGTNYIGKMKEILNNNVKSSSETSTTVASTSSSATSVSSSTLVSSSTSTAHSHTHLASIEQSDVPVIISTTTLAPVVSTSAFPSTTVYSFRATTTLSPVSVTSSEKEQQKEPETVFSAITSTLSLVTPITTSITSVSTTQAAAETSATISESQVIETTTTTTATASPATSIDTYAHTRVKELNAQYAAGQYNGQSTCTDGEFVCDAIGKFAICNYGTWVSIECAAGTTCFAYDSNNEVFTGCNFSSLKSDFV